MNGTSGHHSVEGLTEAVDLQQRSDLDLLRRFLIATASIEPNADHCPFPSVPFQPTFTTRGFAFREQIRETTVNGITNDVNDKLSSPSGRRLQRAGSILRVLILDLPLAALFLILLCTYHAQHLYKEYFVHIIKSAGRAASDVRLQSEYTYYERACTANDLSTRNLQDLLLTNGTTPVQAVDTMMKHGAAMIPQVLKPSTVEALRKFIVRRNAELTEEDEIFVSQGEGNTRVSFGIDATEDPIVPIALREIATNPTLQPLIEGLVGSDPAVTEITAITARFGATHQSWHPDVKPDGNGIKFARTFSHSYSMFVALQDTSSAMGATELCPGTHYCANWLDVMCAENGIQLNAAASDKLWHAGDAALLNQQIWHRGYKHSDPNSLERILFIVSFIGRPQHGIDPRQLSRGTYFHMKWNMWGHTWADLFDAQRSMVKHFSILRCLGLWKPKNRNWGYDLVTSAMMRMANGQMGVHWSELPDFIDTVIDRIGIPKLLQGPVLKNNRAWETYLRDTTKNCLIILEIINLVVLSTYGVAILLVSFKTRKRRHITRAFLGLAFTHVFPALVLYRVQRRIEFSRWGQDVKLGRILNEPFDVEVMEMEDLSLSTGPTTLPEKEDVLIGSRFDSYFLGAYDRWLDYHPGNAAFRLAIAHYAPFVKSFVGLPDIFLETLTDSILETTRGRFLEQDWRNGQWRRLTESDTKKHVGLVLNLASKDFLRALHKCISLQLAHYRFDAPVRHTILGYKSRDNLLTWRKLLFESADKNIAAMPLVPRQPEFKVKSIVQIIPQRQIPTVEPYTYQHHRWRHPPLPPASLITGETVAVNYDGKGQWFRGSIGGLDGETCQVNYEDGETQGQVSMDIIRRYRPLEEGALVTADYGESGVLYPGLVKKVMPSGNVDILYDDGSLKRNVPSSQWLRLNY